MSSIAALHVRYKYWHICNGNRTEWSPIRSVIIQVITKSDDDLFITSMITDRIGRHDFREKKNNQVMKEREICI